MPASKQSRKRYVDVIVATKHLKKAVSLADKASDGEKFQILAAEAGANGDLVKQKAYLDKLVAACPNEERAHFNMGGYNFDQ